MDKNAILEMIKNKHIEGVSLNLTEIDVNNIDFSGCTIINVTFSCDELTNKKNRSVKFKESRLNNVKFSNSVLYKLDFDNAVLDKVSFRSSSIKKCRFRNTVVTYNDFRYSKIENSTFQSSKINFCDFYRARFIGNNIFIGSLIESCSISTYFEGSTFRKENLANGRILQQEFKKYSDFLKKWHEVRLNDTNEKATFNIDEGLNLRFEQAENIYRELSGMWNSKGFHSDANWAYIQAKRMERAVSINKFKKDNKNKLTNLSKIISNWIVDFSFGYGESVLKTIRTYVLIILLSTIFIYFVCPLDSILTSLEWSFKNMVAQTPNEIINHKSFIVKLFSVLQSTIGVLLTGIFGFIIANKIRNQ